MFTTFIEILSWGLTTASVALIISFIISNDIKTTRNMLLISFIIGCIKGYTEREAIV